MNLLRSFKDFITKENLFSPKDRLLLAISGGVDSMVLCELCHQAGFDFIIVHCNFQLRGAESDRDEQFVRQLANRYGKEVLVREFDTEQYAAQKKLSIQVAARELRYSWFHTLIGAGPADQHSAGQTPAGPKFILTAHHLDDNIETLLMNFFKGTGIAGLRAMLPRQGAVIRPLLFATKSQLLQFAEDHQLKWVEDSSNQSDKYTRNSFRHQFIPLLQQSYPGVLDNLAANIDRFREIELLYHQAVEQQRKKLLEYKGNEVLIPVLKLKKATPLHSIVYEVISAFGFSPQQVNAVIDLLDSPSGKYIRSATHRILKNRNWLIISPSRTIESLNILVESTGAPILFEQGILHLGSLPVSAVPPHILPPAGHKPSVPPSATSPRSAGKPASGSLVTRTTSLRPGAEPIAWLDAAHIQFPLLLRKWQPGDYFYPLGMRKKKKLSRFLIDSKLSLADKEKIWVLEMDKKIIWVVGLRIDDRFRITPQTREVVKIELKFEVGMA